MLFKKQKFSLFLLIFLMIFFSLSITKTEDASENSATSTVDKKITQKEPNKRKKHKKKIPFHFVDKPLIDLINELAAEKKVNILLPQGPAAISPNTKVTFHFQEDLTLDQAWNQLIAILDIAGYAIEQEGRLYSIKKLDQNINRIPVNIYIDPMLSKIPNTDEIIRAVFYLANLNLKTHGNEINTILKDMLSATADVKSDTKTNALILTDKSANILAAMKIILELDKTGIRDQIEVLPLYYTSALLIEDLFNKNILETKGQPTEASYFPKNTKVFGLERINALVIMGAPRAIEIVKDFILKYLDVPMESGKSILHIYDLQYLDAKQFSTVLQKVVSPAQADQATGKIIGGPKQYFKDVIITFEHIRESAEIRPTKVQAGGPTYTAPSEATSRKATIGGNRLIIAARNKDWIRIKHLIQYLDKPQQQIALEVLVVDLSLRNEKLFGSQIRDKTGFNQSISKNVNFQSAQLGQPVLTDGTPLPADALMANLLQLGPPTFPATQNLANTALPGSLIFSLADSQSGNGIWAVLQVLNMYANTTILSQPFIVTQNHNQATVTISQQRLLQGDADASSVAVKVNREWVTAALTIDILPHISASKNISLQIILTVNEFVSANVNTRITRVIQTNANVGNNQILALGGLTRVRNNIDKSQVPILGNLPIVGWFFKREQVVKEKNNLVILISPTIIEPKISGGIDDYSQQKLDFAKNNLDEQLNFQNLRDPVTRWFFKPNVCTGEIVDEYTEKVLGVTDTYEESKRQEEKYKNVFSTKPKTTETREPDAEIQENAIKQTMNQESQSKQERPAENSKSESINKSEDSEKLKSMLQEVDNPLTPT